MNTALRASCLLFLLRPHDNLLGCISTLQLLYALNDFVPADSIHNLVLDRLQRADGEMSLKGPYPSRNVLSHFSTNRLIKPAKMAERGAVLLDLRRRVERGPISLR